MFENPNTNDGVERIMKDLQQYQSSYGDGHYKKFSSLPLVGDELTVERGVNRLQEV